MAALYGRYNISALFMHSKKSTKNLDYLSKDNPTVIPLDKLGLQTLELCNQ